MRRLASGDPFLNRPLEARRATGFFLERAAVFFFFVVARFLRRDVLVLPPTNPLKRACAAPVLSPSPAKPPGGTIIERRGPGLSFCGMSFHPLDM